MPLIVCTVCGKQISKRAVMCPGCGEPDPVNYHLKKTWAERITWLTAWVAIGAVIWYQVVPWATEYIKQVL